MRATGKHGGKLKPRKLKDLVKEHCQINIQIEGEAHSSIDDAKATMELYKVMRSSREKEIEEKSKHKKRK